MNIKSITFDCPILYRGKLSFIEEVRAPELNSFVNGITYNKTQYHLLVVNYNNSQYVIDVLKHTPKNDKCYSIYLSQLSSFLQATVSIIKVTLNEDTTYSFETVQSSVYKLTGLSIEDEILHEFPKLCFVSNYHIQEYNTNYSEVQIPSWIKSNHIYLIVLPFKDKQYIVGSYTRRAKANSLINKAELRNAFIVDIERKSNHDEPMLLKIEEDESKDLPVEDLKSISVADLDLLL